MRKQLYDELVCISDDIFDRLCDDILECLNPEYAYLDARGMHLYKNKPVKGTPDSLKLFSDGSIYAFQYTTSEELRLKDKLIDDIEKVYNWRLGNRVKKLILCCNSRLKDDVIDMCIAKCSEYGWELQMVGIDDIISLILDSYDAKVKVNKYFPFDVFSINLETDLRHYIEYTYLTEACSEINENYHRKLLKFNISALDLSAISSLDNTELDFNTNQNVALIGGAGAGKSTLLKRWFLNKLNIADYQLIPVLCELRGYSGETLPEYIKLNFEKGSNQINIELIKKLLLEGHFQIFLDGLDELSEKYFEEFKIKCLWNTKYSKNTFIVSSRNSENIEKINSFKTYSIKPLNYNAISTFILNIIPEVSSTIFEFCDKNSNIIPLLSNPFNLTVIVSIILSFNGKESIVKFLKHCIEKRHYFYEELVKKMMIWNREILSKYRLKETFIMHIISSIAYRVICDWKNRMDLRYFNKLIWEILNEYSLIGQISVDDVRDCLIDCKFIQNISDLYQFEHNNILEYLASIYILNNKEDAQLIDSVLKHPAMCGVLLIVFEKERTIFDRNIESMPFYIFQRVVDTNNDLVSDYLVHYAKSVFVNSDKKIDISKAIYLCSQFYYDKRFLLVIFEYLSKEENKSYQGFQKFRNQNDIINSIFNCMPGFAIIEGLNIKDILELLTDSHKYGRASAILASEYLSHLSEASEEEWNLIKNFYLNCFQFQEKEFLYFILINIDMYFRIKPKGVYEVFEVFKKTYEINDWGFANSYLIEMLEEMGEIECCDNTGFVRNLVDRALNCEKNCDYNVGQQLATLNFEEIEYLYSAPQKVRLIIGDEVYKKTMLFSFNDPEINTYEDTLSAMILYISEFTDEITLNILRKYCRFTTASNHYFYNGKWNGVRTDALKGLYTDANNEKLNALLSEFYNSNEFTYKIFFLYGIYRASISKKCKKTQIANIKYIEVYNSLVDQLRNNVKLKESLFHIGDFINSFHSSVYFSFFIFNVLSDLPTSQVIGICFEILRCEEESERWNYILDIVKYIGNVDWLNNLMHFNEKNPNYSDKVADIISKWYTTPE